MVVYRGVVSGGMHRNYCNSVIVLLLRVVVHLLWWFGVYEKRVMMIVSALCRRHTGGWSATARRNMDGAGGNTWRDTW